MKTKIILEEHVKCPESNEMIFENEICTIKCSQVKQAEHIKFLIKMGSQILMNCMCNFTM